MTFSSAFETGTTEHVRRTGPIGRGARLVLALVIGAFVALRVATLATNGPAGYRDPAILADPSLWILTAIVIVSVIDFAGRFAPGLEGVTPAARRMAATVALALLAVGAAAIGLALRGSVWGFPLADGWWWLNTAYLGQLAVAFVLAAVLGTPGCEQGVWRELVSGQKGANEHTALTCVIGLHLLDSWEAENRADPEDASRS
jgi:hypothetical protein